jgi:hypothetical protein
MLTPTLVYDEICPKIERTVGEPIVSLWGIMTFVWALVSALERLRDFRQALTHNDQNARISHYPDDVEELNPLLDYIGSNIGDFDLDAGLDRIGHVKRMVEIDASVEVLAMELRVLSQAIEDQLKRRQFIFVPVSKSEYYDAPNKIFSQAILDAFPTVKDEMVEACRSYATERNTASVFHSMGILQKGLYALAAELGVDFPEGIELENWQNVIDRIEAKIREKEKALKKGQEKDATLKFYSQAAVQFRYFKDAWRNHVAHLREVYDPDQAHSILMHVRDFMKELTKHGLHDPP